MINQALKQYLDNNEKYRNKLYNFGFLLTDSNDIETGLYPFYDNWQYFAFYNWNLLVNKNQSVCFVETDGVFYVIVGHCVNPFDMKIDERDILSSLSRISKEKQIGLINELTGIFTLFIISSAQLICFGDACTIQSIYYGFINSKLYITTHENIVGDILGLQRSEYVEHLINYKYFRLFGNQLPGDISQFNELNRLVPNHYLSFSQDQIDIKRFYYPHTVQLEDKEIASQAADLLQKTMACFVKKWEKPAVSLSGGCDSRTTLSCAKDFYSSFYYYSFISSDEEAVDCDAAKQLCKCLGLEHKTYLIPENDGDIEDVEIIRMILDWNIGNLLPLKKSEVRKQAFFSKINDFDIEIKSWVSEIGRAYYSKRFNGRKKFGKISPRKCTTLYKFFLFDRSLVRETDLIFKRFIQQYLSQIDFSMPWQEQFFWEFRMSSWNGRSVTGEHRFSHNITFPYNNRLLLELLLSGTQESRVHDLIYAAIRNKMDHRIDDACKIIKNVKHTESRARLENLYYIFNNLLPF